MKLVKKSLYLAVLLSAVTASVALAAVITGTNGNDRLVGTNSADTINALAGNDAVWGRFGNDTISAGDGVALVYGAGSCSGNPSSANYCESSPNETSQDGDDTINGDK